MVLTNLSVQFNVMLSVQDQQGTDYKHFDFNACDTFDSNVLQA